MSRDYLWDITITHSNTCKHSYNECNHAMPMKSIFFRLYSTFFTIILSVTMVTRGQSHFFRVFSILQTIDFVLGSNCTSSRHATSYCLDGVNGTNPISTMGIWPPVNMVPEVDGRVSGLSWIGLCSWSSPPRSSSFFLLFSLVQSSRSCPSSYGFKASWAMAFSSSTILPWMTSSLFLFSSLEDYSSSYHYFS